MIQSADETGPVQVATAFEMYPVTPIIYSHRIQGVLQQVVKDLELTLTISDADCPISLKDNHELFLGLADMLNVEFIANEQNGVSIFTFRNRK